MKTIYFLCTGNSCRSQIAEGYGKQILGDVAEIHSAGIEAHGKNPRAIEIMKEDGLDISNQESSVINESLLQKSDFIITLCGNADERCPTVPSRAKRIHWGLSDPAKATGTEDEIKSEFRKTREEVKRRIQDFRDEYFET